MLKVHQYFFFYKDCARVPSYLGEISAGRVGAKKFALDMLLNALDDAVFVQKVDLMLRGVDIHVYILRSDL